VRIESAVWKCSGEVQDMDRAIKKPTPEPGELGTDIEELSSFVEETH
jgi:hypothetical protein